jgi:hypothetical protein
MPYSVGEKGSYGCSGYPVLKDDDKSVMGCHSTAQEAGAQIAAIEANENKTYEEKDTVTNDGGMGIKNPDEWPVSKADPCWEGYTQRGMKPGDNGRMVPNCVPVAKADDMFEDDDDVEYDDDMSKAETFSPNSGMKAAARRALKWKEDGKATGAGTPVGWGRASDIVAGRAMSLSTVRRMFSFFSRHEAASKGGKDFNNTSNPSNGRIMWDAWGGNAGFAWSRAIVNRMKDKALFANFGKDFTRSTGMPDLFKAVSVGSMVSWNSSGGRAEGKITRIIRDGRYNVPGTEVTVTGTPEDPAAVIRLYRDGKPTDTIVAHKLKTLRGK